MKRRLYKVKASFFEYGFIACLVPSSFNFRKKLGRERALTHHPVGDRTASKFERHI